MVEENKNTVVYDAYEERKPTLMERAKEFLADPEHQIKIALGICWSAAGIALGCAIYEAGYYKATEHALSTITDVAIEMTAKKVSD